MIELKIQEVARTRTIQTARGARPIENIYLFALAINKPPATAKRLWAGTLRKVDLSLLDLVCEALDCDPCDLLVRTKPKTAEKKSRKR